MKYLRETLFPGRLKGGKEGRTWGSYRRFSLDRKLILATGMKHFLWLMLQDQH